jgi:neutral ceramidase
MIRISLNGVIKCIALLLCISAAAVIPAEKGSLRAGAAKIEITPPADAALRMYGYAGRTDGFKGIHDDLNVRAIVMDDGSTQAAIVAAEIGSFSNDFWEKITKSVTQATGIPRENIILAAIHTHAAPIVGSMGGPPLRPESTARLQANSVPPAPPDPQLEVRQAAFGEKVEIAVVESVRQAKARLQPSRIGFGTGKASVNTNRRARNGEGGWMLGNNPEGASDKTVAVIKLETASGEPFAVFSNYGCHATILGPANFQVSSDLAGATARYVEKHYAGKVISSWTSGTAGDQDPIYRVGTDFRNVAALGEILGEEVVKVADGIKTTPGAHIRPGVQKIVTCPGKRTVQAPGPGREYKFEDADPVSIRLSLLVINDIAIAGVSGEVLTNIGLRLKRESPFNRTIMVTHCNGSSGYLADDAAYDQVSYEITSTRAKRGCAEDSIVNGLLEMMGAFF